MGTIERRRSIRNFGEDEVKRETVETILDAGLRAPSPKNRQPWRFIVIMDKELKRSLVDSMRNEIHLLLKKERDRKDIYDSLRTMEIIDKAPVLVFVCYEYGMVVEHDDGVDWKLSATDLEAVELQSIGAAVENMLLKAEELGLGSLWCADILYAYKAISKLSERPIVSAVCFGYKKEQPDDRERKSIREMCFFADKQVNDLRVPIY